VLLGPCSDVGQAGPERVGHDVVGVVDEQRVVAQTRVPRDLFEHLGVVVGGKELFAAAALWHGQVPDEIGEPGIGGPLEVGVLVQEVAHGGSNNALRSVADKHVAWSDTEYETLEGKNGFTVWRPTHFALEYGRVVDAVHQIDARRVVLVTVPHVTIAPIAKGVNPAQPGQKWREGSRYFPYYTDPWIEEADFDPTKHRCITHGRSTPRSTNTTP
jgi:hypothetical protein